MSCDFLGTFGHRILIKPDPVETTTASGIIVELNEEAYANATTVGTVLEIGPEAFKAFNRAAGTEQPWFKVGDRIGFGRYAGKSIIDPKTKERYLVINDEDAVVIYKKD